MNLKAFIDAAAALAAAASEAVIQIGRALKRRIFNLAAAVKRRIFNIIGGTAFIFTAAVATITRALKGGSDTFLDVSRRVICQIKSFFSKKEVMKYVLDGGKECYSRAYTFLKKIILYRKGEVPPVQPEPPIPPVPGLSPAGGFSLGITAAAAVAIILHSRRQVKPKLRKELRREERGLKFFLPQPAPPILHRYAVLAAQQQ